MHKLQRLRMHRHRCPAQKVLHLVNGSNIYRKCWSLKSKKACYRHKELSYCFDRAAAVLFLADMACYDQFDGAEEGESDDLHKNRRDRRRRRRRGADNVMNQTVKLFQWLLKDYSLFLKKGRLESGKVVLVMDGLLRFRQKVENNVSIARCSSFRKYGGGPLYEESRDFVVNKFRALCVYSNITLSVQFRDGLRTEEFVNVITGDGL